MDIIQQLVKLVKINTRISSLHTSPDILREIMNEAMTLTGTSSAFVLRVSPAREIACEGEFYRDERRVTWSSTSALEAHDKQRIVYATRASESAGPSIVRGGIQTLISVPVTREENGTLLLQLAGQDATSMDAQALPILALFVSQVQVTMSKAKLEASVLGNARLAAAGELAAQVAHDIRSPLAALDSIRESADGLPEETRLVLWSAVGRIRDIANALIDKYRDPQGGVRPPRPAPPSPQLLSSLIDSLVSEKRAQYRSREDLRIEAALGAEAYGLFASVQPVEFKRLLSNLINNGVEAMNDKGCVTVTLRGRGDEVLLSIRDTGRGIPPEVLSKLGPIGETHDKPGGSGLGLYHARRCAESWGGRLDICSQAGNGAEVIVVLPRAAPPEWFVSELRLSPGAPLVVVDDDPCIHHVWRARLETLRAGASGIEAWYFSSPEELKEWARARPAAARAAVYLMDFDLRSATETGLTLIEALGLREQAILVTSRFEEDSILERCVELGVRLIPKASAGSVPIVVEEPARRACAALIDDDPLVHMTWRIAARKARIDLRSFSSLEQFEKAESSIPRDAEIYLDSALPGSGCGEAYVPRLRQLGFQKISLATGRDPANLGPEAAGLPVIGKEPPFVPA